MSDRSPSRKVKGKSALVRIGVAGAFLVLSAFGLNRLDRAYPPPMDRPSEISVEVLDRNGVPLHFFLNQHGRWRLQTSIDSIDPHYLNMLLAYEDKRFYRHWGVDPLAMARAVWQLVTHQRVVSGGSTITMQLARLLEPRSQRSIGAKLRQIARAFQLERRLSKREILQKYLTLAPFGGNLEGIRAGAQAWFGKEPRRLSVEQAALLIALPQSPESRRPDRHPAQARQARNRVLARLTAAGALDLEERQRVIDLPMPTQRLRMPQLAGHVARAAIDKDPQARRHPTRLDAPLQSRLETHLRRATAQLPPKTSAAMMVVDAQSGDILAALGSPDLMDSKRQGWLDMTRHKRSPGSTLKPLVYGLAIEDGHVLPETMITDQSSNFSGYRPANFDQSYQGDVTVRQALQMSLNVPAVHLLEAVSVPRLLSRMQRAGIRPATGKSEAPGLSLVLGGASLSLHDLVQLYANLVHQGPTPLLIGDGIHTRPGTGFGRKPLSKVAVWHVTDMLAGIAEPIGSKPRRIAYKTGTSYGYRDAWAIGYDGRYVMGVWVGRPDNAPVPGSTGIKTAAPILFEAFEKSQLSPVAFPPAPPGAVRSRSDQLNPAMKKFVPRSMTGAFSSINPARRMTIHFPQDGHELELSETASGNAMPLAIKLQGGVPPFALLANGRPVERPSRRRHLFWHPASKGTARLTVLDSIGQANSIEIRIR